MCAKKSQQLTPLGRRLFLPFILFVLLVAIAHFLVMLVFNYDVHQVSINQILPSLIALILLTSIVLIVISTLWRDIINPLKNTVMVAREMIEGNYQLRAPSSRILELDQLSNTINALAEQIQTEVDVLNKEIAERKRAEESEREQRLLAESLREATAALNSTLNSDQVLDRILASIDQVIPHEGSSIMLIEGAVARVIKSRGTTNSAQSRLIIGRELVVAQFENLMHMLQTGKPALIQDTQKYAGWVDIPETSWIRSYLGTPIQAHGQIIGFLNVDSSIPNFFTTKHVEALRAFAAQAGIAIENAHLFDELHKMLSETTRLYELSTTILTPSSREETARLIVETLREGFHADAAAILVLDSHGQPAFRYSIGLSEKFYQEAQMRPTGSTAQVQRTGKPVILSTPEQINPRVRAEGIQAVIALPLQVQADQLGVLYLNYRQPHHWSEREIELLSIFANQAALALANAQLRETLHEQAIRDPITGLFNRRYMEETLRRELHRANRRGSTLGVIMLDIDHFKDWNDTYGHAAGDLILHKIGDTLQSHTRSEDVSCRYGGEELFVILPDASLEDTFRRAEELRQRIRNIRLEFQGRTLDAVTVSIGVAVFPKHGGDANSIVRAADQALYQAKDQGRDRVVAA